MNKKFLGLCLALVLISPVITFAASDTIYEDVNTSISSAGSGSVNLNSYGVSTLTIQVQSQAYGASQVGGNSGYSGYAEANLGTYFQVDDVPNGTDPMTVSTNEVRVFDKDGSGNWSTGGVGVSNIVNLSSSAWVNGNDAVGTATAGGYVYYTPATVGTINVTSNPAASWTITNPATLPATLTGSGISQSYPNQTTAGTYTITWGDISGYITPDPEIRSLTVGVPINFVGNYVASTACTVQDSISGTIHTYNEGEADFDDFWNAFRNSNVQFTGSGFAGILRYRACGTGGTGCGSPFGVWSAAPATRRPTIPAACASFAPKCSNGIDDDADGLIDTSDPQCHSDSNPANPGSFTPTVDTEGSAPSVNLNFI